MSAIDLSSDLGLVACFLLTFNLLLGLLLALGYNPWTHWPHRRFNYFRIHNWTAYLALCAATLHPTILLLVREPRFRLIDVLVPVASPQQPIVNTIGALALYALVLVVVTSYARHRFTRRAWKRLHYAAYAVAGAFPCSRAPRRSHPTLPACRLVRGAYCSPWSPATAPGRETLSG